MHNKIPIHIIPIKYEFESNQAAELYRKAFFPHLPQQTSPPQSSEPPTLWIDEAIKYLGLDRTGNKRPDKAIHRLITKGALNPQKILGRLVFGREELDRVLANGDHKMGRGRPRKR